jgi:hypothetical protein
MIGKKSGRYLRQIALVFYFEELSESSRELDTNILYLTDGDRFSEYPKYDTSMQRCVWQVDPLPLTHQLEKFIQGQFGTDSRIWLFEIACEFRWKLCCKVMRFTAG